MKYTESGNFPDTGSLLLCLIMHFIHSVSALLLELEYLNKIKNAALECFCAGHVRCLKKRADPPLIHRIRSGSGTSFYILSGGLKRYLLIRLMY